jgi:hypothetical protein
MQDLEYIEGRKATENFEAGMKALCRVPKSAVLKRQKKSKQQRITSVRKTKRADKD